MDYNPLTQNDLDRAPHTPDGHGQLTTSTEVIISQEFIITHELNTFLKMLCMYEILLYFTRMK